MVQRSVITVTTGEAGSGKTYCRCARFLLDRFLPDADGVHWSNFPIGLVPDSHTVPPEREGETFRDRIAEEAEKRHGIAVPETLRRVQIIPEDELQRWLRKESGPWEFFADKDLSGAHIALDEVHNYLGPGEKQAWAKLWRDWLGEIRHCGATVEFISQALQKVPLEIRREAGSWIELKNTDTERDPFFKVELADWYELRASWITREYTSKFTETYRRSAMPTSGLAKVVDRRVIEVDPWFFRFYDSFSAPQKGGRAGQSAKKQWQRRTRVGLLLWFALKNAGRLIPKLLLVAFMVWLVAGGGRWLVEGFIDRSMEYAGVTDTSQTGNEGTDNGAMEQNAEGGKDLVSAAELASALAEPSAVTEREPVVLVGIGADSIYLSDGRRLSPGETLQGGELNGETLVRINRGRREAVFGSGLVLRMGLGRARGGLFR